MRTVRATSHFTNPTKVAHEIEIEGAKTIFSIRRRLRSERRKGHSNIMSEAEQDAMEVAEEA